MKGGYLNNMINNSVASRELLEEHRRKIAVLMYFFGRELNLLAEVHEKDRSFTDTEIITHVSSDSNISARFKNDMSNMTLFDVMEYLAENYLLSKDNSNNNVDFVKLANAHNIDPQLVKILQNTVQYLDKFTGLL